MEGASAAGQADGRAGTIGHFQHETGIQQSSAFLPGQQCMPRDIEEVNISGKGEDYLNRVRQRVGTSATLTISIPELLPELPPELLPEPPPSLASS